jgi:hypothetical protein
MSQKRSGQPLTVLVFLVTLLLAGCGNDGKSGAAPTTAGEATSRDLLADGGVVGTFEDSAGGSAGWKALNSARVARSTKESHSGTAAMLVSTQGKAKFEGAWTKPFLEVQPGDSFRASAWIRVPEGARVGLQLIERDADDEYVDGVTQTVGDTGEWFQADVEWTFSDAAEQASVQVTTAGSPQQLRFFVDDVELVPAGPS